MAFDINKRPDKTAWINFSDDEKYLLKYMPQLDADRIQKSKKIDDEILEYIIDWDGIVSDGEPLECNIDNKKIVFTQLELWSTERLQFCLINCQNPNNFYSLEDNLKNLKRG